MARPIENRRARGRRRVRRRRTVLGAGLVVLALAIVLVSGPFGGHQVPARARHHPTGSVQRRSAVKGRATFPGPDGVEARWVVAENHRPGTTAWQISGEPGPSIEGYASATAAGFGDTVTLYVSTAATHFHVEAYRMGYYQGLGARLVWRSPEETGVSQPACPVTPGVNMVSCAWASSLFVRVTSAFVQGDYLLKLVADPGGQSYVPLTVWDPTSHAAYLIDNSVFTWQAWNLYGGYDMYGGAPPGRTPTFADRARVMSYDRPYAYGNGAGDFLGNELPLVRFVEQYGLDVTYVTDVVFSEHPDAILDHRAFLSLGHAECWSNPERAAAQSAIAHGVNLVFFAASPILRHVRLQPGADGTADREMVDYRDPQEDPLYGIDNDEVTGNTWAQPPTDRPASAIVGDTYGGYGINDPMIVTDPSAWPFAGTGLTSGAQLAHVVQFDFDYYDRSGPDPPDVEILAHSPVPDGTRMAGVTDADMTYYTEPGTNAGVIATGTNAWIGSLGPCPPSVPACPAPQLRTITTNILRVFGAGPAGLTHPSITNWQQFA